MITASNILKGLIVRHYAEGVERAPTSEDLGAELRRLGIPHAPAIYDTDTAGRCLTCGEPPETCPGIHTFEEIQSAARADLKKVGDEGATAVQRPAARAALNAVYGTPGHIEPPADPCHGCLKVGITNCLNCIEKEAGRAD